MKDLSAEIAEINTALKWVFDRSKGFREKPDLTEITLAVQDLLVAAGYPALEAVAWERFEWEGRAAQESESWQRELRARDELNRYPRF